jgi:hypothetical protein
VGRAERLVDRRGQVCAHGVDVGLFAHPLGERGGE